MATPMPRGESRARPQRPPAGASGRRGLARPGESARGKEVAGVTRAPAGDGSRPADRPSSEFAKDTSAARTALRRAGFNPRVFGARVGVPPEKAPDLDYKIAVHEPEAWPQSESDQDRNRRMLAVLREARIRALVGGVQSLPGISDPEPWGLGGVPAF
jgi:hypothetical protein